MRRRVDLRPGRAQLEATFSRAEVMAYLGIQKSKLGELVQLGRRFHGVHPTKGGLWPVFRPSHKVVRIPQSAIERHLEHMERMRSDPLYSAQQRARLNDQEAA